ncbi:MAG: hypothetical protein AAB520_00765, partial [Patescibacteria group bacterium]
MDPNNVPLQNTPQVSPVAAPAEPGFPPQDPQKSNKNLIIFAAAIFIGVMIIGAIASLLYFTKPSQTNTTSYNPTPVVEQKAKEEAAVAEVK